MEYWFDPDTIRSLLYKYLNKADVVRTAIFYHCLQSAERRRNPTSQTRLKGAGEY